MGEKIISAIVWGLYIIGVLGWIINLFLFFGLNFSAPYRAEVIRGIGVVSPLGAVMGYVTIED
jgi:hypothetical protein